jgi:hypothetical protein
MIFAAAAACGGSQKDDHENPFVQGSDVSPQCCCKTIPAVAEKDIVPNYAMSGRMECSTQQGTCVDDVQCNAQTGSAAATPMSPPADTGAPPAPDLGSGG